MKGWTQGRTEEGREEEKSKKAGRKDIYSVLKVFEYCFHLSLMHHNKCLQYQNASWISMAKKTPVLEIFCLL